MSDGVLPRSKFYFLSSFSPNRKMSISTIELHRLAVDSKSRGLGIGQKLIQELEKIAILEKYSHIYLETTNADTRPHKLYEKLGFQFLKFRHFWEKLPILDNVSGTKIMAFIKKIQ